MPTPTAGAGEQAGAQLAPAEKNAESAGTGEACAEESEEEELEIEGLYHEYLDVDFIPLKVLILYFDRFFLNCIM